ncbi:MAG: NTP transferase domain-containing protein [Muribaculaceae bacterium]|nr:NTP transferase domain-containing protein [Muribaculaceae bacterium]
MKAMVLAAGLGSRLKPWTLEHPKALVPVQGVPMLERVIDKLRREGFDEIVVNIHHFGEQIVEFLRNRDFGIPIHISDESDRLLDTGGAILHALDLLKPWESPVLIHNVDILSDANLHALMEAHESGGADSTLLVSDRESSRHLIFDEEMNLRGWHHVKDNLYRPSGFIPRPDDREYAFSGIHVVGEGLADSMKRKQKDEKFPIMDFLLRDDNGCRIKGVVREGLRLIDIGKPATLSQANMDFLGKYS